MLLLKHYSNFYTTEIITIFICLVFLSKYILKQLYVISFYINIKSVLFGRDR